MIDNLEIASNLEEIYFPSYESKSRLTLVSVIRAIQSVNVA